MAFELQPGESAERGLQRVARAQLKAALREIDDAELDVDVSVHQVRKRVKKLRALLRLFSDGLGKTRKTENAELRDAARLISSARDAAVLVETAEDLRDRHARHQARRAGEEKTDSAEEAHRFDPIVRALERRRDAPVDAPPLEARLAEVRDRLAAVHERVKGWPAQTDLADALKAGLKEGYRRGRHALRQAQADPSPEMLHEWRKRAKDLRHHLELARPAWPTLVKAWADEARRLADQLGEAHDLAMLEAALLEAAAPDWAGADVDAVQRLIALARHRRHRLEARAFALGRRLYHDKPGAWASRLADWWRLAESPEVADADGRGAPSG